MRQRLLAIILGLFLVWPLFAMAGYKDQPQMQIPVVVGEYLAQKIEQYGGTMLMLTKMCPLGGDCVIVVLFRDPSALEGKGMTGSYGTGTFVAGSNDTLGVLLKFIWPDGKVWQREIGVTLPDVVTKVMSVMWS